MESANSIGIAKTQQEKIGFSSRYIFALSVFYRITLIIFLLGGWVAAASSQKFKDFYGYTFKDIQSIRDVYLIFGISGFVLATFILMIDLFNVCNVKPFNKFPINPCLIILDLIWFISLAIISIFCIMRARYMDQFTINDGGVVIRAFDYYSPSAFYIAGAFGFIACLLYLAEIFYLTVRILSKRKK